MKRILASNLSVNAFQLIINQLLGLGIFYVLSTGLNKDTFGQINLALAILLAAFNILSFGIDQLVIKKIAAGDNVQSLLSIYIAHVLIAGLGFYALLLGGFFLLHNIHAVYSLLLLIGIGKMMIFFASPFKQAANGMEKFRLLAFMSVTSNLIRCCGLICVALFHSLSLLNVVIIFIGGDIIELIFCVFLYNRAINIPLRIKWDKINYIKLLRESLPQTGVVLITSALARFDWIFIGFMVSAVKLAEYSFAYKIFEISTLPLLAIAPLLIPRFTKMFQQGEIPVAALKLLVKIEMIVAAFVGLLLNICWSPVIDGITAGKYGLINVKTIFILSLCMPLLYLNNFLWTVYFAQGRLKMILTSFIITLSVNIAGDILLIPIFKNEGAAFAFFAACLVQTIFYLNKNTIAQLKFAWYPLPICVLCAILSGFASKALLPHSWLVLPLAIVFYIALLFATSQIRLSERNELRDIF